MKNEEYFHIEVFSGRSSIFSTIDVVLLKKSAENAVSLFDKYDTSVSVFCVKGSIFPIFLR